MARGDSDQRVSGEIKERVVLLGSPHSFIAVSHILLL